MIYSLLLSQKINENNHFKLLITFHMCLSIIIVLFGLTTLISIYFLSSTYIFGIMFILKLLFGAIIVACNVVLSIIIQYSCSKEYVGRIFGFEDTFQSILSPISMITGGYLIDRMSSYIFPLISGLFLGLFTISLYKRLKGLIK